MKGACSGRWATALAWVLGVALLGGVAAEAPAQSGSQCLRAEVPPAPPAQGAVLWAPPDSQNPTAPNAIVLAYSQDFSQPLVLYSKDPAFPPDPMHCIKVLKNLQAITIAPGKALMALCHNTLPTGDEVVIVPWGAVNVAMSDPRPLDFTSCWADHPDASVQKIQLGVTDPAYVAVGWVSSCRQCDLSGLHLTLTDDPFVPSPMSQVDFSGADLRGATLSGNGAGYDFSRADLSGATFAPGTSLENAVFDGATLDGTDFRGATIGGKTGTCTRMADANLLSASFAVDTWVFGCSGALFRGSQVPLGLVRDLVLFGGKVDFKDALTGAQIVASLADWRSLAGADLSGVNLSGAGFLGVPVDLTGARFDGATLSQTDFGLARLAGATFKNVKAASASFTGADLSADGTRPGASFAGPETNLQGANFVNANLSGDGTHAGASFQGADLTGAVFTGARGVGTNFNGVRARNAVFSRVHLYGNGEAFDSATDLQNADFSGAVLAADASLSGGFDFTNALLRNARFDGAICVACNFTNATLTQASFTGAYLPGVILAGATLTGASFDQAWLYCGNTANDWCARVAGRSPSTWAWPLALGSGEAYGPVPFQATSLTGVSLATVTACPDGNAGSTPPTGCRGRLLPNPSEAPAIPAPCSASAGGACPTRTSTLLDASTVGEPLAIVPTAPPTWNTLLSGEGYYVSFDDGTIRFVDGPATIIAGTPGTRCPAATAPCGDGGPATSALLGTPSGLAVGLDGSLYIADSGLLRVRRINPSGVITTIAGTGARCGDPPCGDFGPATAASLAAANGIWVDTHGVLLIADGAGGVRRVAVDGLIATHAPGSSTGDVQAVTALPSDTAGGMIYASTRSPDALIRIDPTTGAVTRVVGTGTPGYNGNTDPLFGTLLLGTQVQVNRPIGLSADLEGNVVFADSGNHLIRAYVPSTGHVIDDLAGVVAGGTTPQGGFNDDGHWADETKLSGPRGVAATRSALLAVADTGNRRIRQVGPGPVRNFEGGRRPDVAALWVGLKNSDDIGLRLDLFAQVSVSGQEIARGQLNNVSAGGSGFNNALLSTIPLLFVPPYTPPVALPDGGELQITLKARRTCSGGGHAAGTARLWFNDAQANSRLAVTINGATTSFFPRSGVPLALGLSPGSGPKKALDVVVSSAVPCSAPLGRPFVPFGTWRITLP